MVQRCTNPNRDGYQDYGGRGIKVCDRWLGKDGFTNFLADMNVPPVKHSLDRVDVNGDYCPENCRWATAQQQAINRRNTVLVNNEPVAVLARRLCVSKLTVTRWAKQGLTVEQMEARATKLKSKHTRLIDETGHVYGKLTVIKRVDNIGKSTAWLCRCTCGQELTVRSQDLRDGVRTACAMCGNKPGGKRAARPPEYGAFIAMRARCVNPHNKNYPYYGGRGVKVCDRWLGKDGFANFLADMGPRPGKGWSLDRIDNNGDYCPANCRWADALTQANNRGGYNHRLTVNGVTRTYAEWERANGLSRGAVARRLAAGIPPEQAVLPGDQRRRVVRTKTVVTVHAYAEFTTELAPDDHRVGTVNRGYTVVNILADGRLLCRCITCGDHVAVRTLTELRPCTACTAAQRRVARVPVGRVTAEDKAACAEVNLVTGQQLAVSAVVRTYGQRPASALPVNTVHGFRWAVMTSADAVAVHGHTLVKVGNRTRTLAQWAADGVDVQRLTTMLVHGQSPAVGLGMADANTGGVVNEVGHLYGRLTVIAWFGLDVHGHTLWRCACTCGQETVVDAGHLKAGAVKSCGCLNREKVSARRFVHGHSGDRLWTTYMNMHARCERPSNARYADYGGREITVCSRWSGDDGFAHFCADMGQHPGKGWSLDRVNVDGNYGPDNCRWADVRTQANNKQTSTALEYNGLVLTKAQWARRLGITPQRLHWQLTHGHDLAELVTRFGD